MRTTPLSAMALVSVVTVGLSALSAPAHAAEEKLAPYIVQKGDTCETIAQKALGDARLTDALHKLNPQLGPRPHHLVEGSTLMLPLPAPDARLELVRNKVEVQSKPGHRDDPLFRGNRVATGDSSAADMKFKDETELSMGERTLVIILGVSRANVAKSSDATLVNGALRSRLGDLAGRSGKPLAIDTPSASVHLGTGETQVTVDPKKATRLAVYTGKSSVTALETTVRVNEGFGSKTLPGKAPGPARPLPAPPDWRSAPAPLSLTQGPPVDVAGEYAQGAAAGPDVATWHVQLARDAAFKDLLVDTRVPSTITRLEAKQLVPGAAFARVSGIDADEFEGPWGATAKMFVARYNQSEEPNRYGSLAPATEGLVCGVDGAAPAVAPSSYDRMSAHVVRCSLATDPSASATVDVPVEGVAGVSLKVHWLSSDPIARTGEVVLELTDAKGAPLSRPGAVILPVGTGATITAVEVGNEPGRFFVKTKWEPGTPVVEYHLVMGSLVADAGPIPVEQPRHEFVEPSAGEAGIGAGVGIVGAGLAQVGVRIEGRIALRASLGPADFILGLAPTFERYGDTSVSASDLGLATAPASLSESHTNYGLGIPFGVRWGSPSTLLRPYVIVTPQMLFQSSSFQSPGATIDGSATYITLLPVIGTELRLGTSGALFLEGGYRGAWTVRNTFAGVSPQGGVVSLGYDIRF